MPGQTFTGNEASTVINQRTNRKKVIYHETTVVEWDQERGIIILDSGGWRTATTKHRMNQASNTWDLELGVYQENYRWYVSTPEGTKEFFDGINLPARKRRSQNPCI